jgi:hypothetical protein
VGWSNEIVAGEVLTIPAIMSPDFSLSAKTGWAILLNGTAYFFGLVTTIGNQLIFQDSNTYPGSAAYLYTIPAGSTSAQSVLFIVGPTDGNLQAILMLRGESEDGTQQPYADLFQYSLSGAAADGGVPLALNNVTVIPGPLTAAALLYASGGQAKYLGADGGAYNTGIEPLITTGSQVVSSTTGVTVTGISAPVAAGTYRVRYRVLYTEGAAAGTPSVYFTGPAASAVAISGFFVTRGSASPAMNTVFASGLGSGNLLSGPVMSGALNKVGYGEGTITFTAAGTFTMGALTSAGADTFTLLAGSFAELIPVS